MQRIRGFLIVTVLASTGLPHPAQAGTRPLPQQQVRPVVVAPALRWRAVPSGPHTFYGTIVAQRGSVVSVRLRSGQLIVVNAAAAIAHGDYSAPLFVGKTVSVDGAEHDGSFTAAHIFRLDNLAKLPLDR